MDYTLQLTISEELLAEITTALQATIKDELPKYQDSFRKDWLTTNEVIKILQVSRRTLQNYRNEGKLSYTQFADNGKVLYPRQEIEAFLQQHMVERKEPASPNSDLPAYKLRITDE